MANMRRRHRINSVNITKQRNGFTVWTNSGSVTFVFVDKDYKQLAYCSRKLKWHLPHLHDEIMDMIISPNDITDWLKGRYIYGEPAQEEYKGMIFDILK